MMAQNLSFSLHIPSTEDVKVEYDATFENFVGQFQLHSSYLLCVINGSTLRYYNNPKDLPRNIRFDYKQRRGKLTEYYFRDIGTETLYCVFGRDCAKIFYPRIDEVDPTGAHELLIKTPRKPKKNVKPKKSPVQMVYKELTITDQGQNMKFPNLNYPIRVHIHRPKRN